MSLEHPRQQPATIMLGDVVKRSYAHLHLRERFKSFIGYVPATRQFKIQLVGGKGSGKSTFALELANEFSRFGSVLYVCAEERPDAGSIRIRAKLLRITNPDIHLLDTTHVEDVDRCLAEGDYTFCFIDSISVMHEGDLATLALSNRFDKVVFIFVNQINAAGEARGSTVVGHACDIVIGFRKDQNDARWAYNDKNRYGATQSEMLVFQPAKAEKASKATESKATWADMEHRRVMRQR